MVSRRWVRNVLRLGRPFILACCSVLPLWDFTFREPSVKAQQNNPSLQARKASLQLTNSTDNYIREVIPDRYRKRYERWKREYLSTQAGQKQWLRYARDPSFALTITVSQAEGHGAEAGKFEWDADGRLIAATIILGSKLDSGYPTSINYPITCTLAPDNLPKGVDGRILAATKLAHEFGHVNRTAGMDGALFRLQNELIPTYITIFKTNGWDTSDPRLIELSRRMKGTPVEIAQDRELWAEANTIEYLHEKFARGRARRSVTRVILRAIESYAQTYPERVELNSLN